MTNFVFDPAPRPALPVAGSDLLFPARRVYCIGRNYAAHAIEMGHDPDREAPFFFQKNPDNLNASGRFAYPSQSRDVHFEAELAVCLKSGGTGLDLDAAMGAVFGYAVALDMTRRDLQGAQKKAGRPWEIGKAVEGSAPIGPIHRIEETGVLERGAITLDLNGDRQQSGDLDQMIWKVPEIIAYLSEYFELAAGDVILTGTPAGVGAVARGDVMDVAIDGLGGIRVTVD
ncbi:MAG: fumarylacetoacetate hydrolase family protein [Marinibacterium sp.]|nr:fumarylacetoacetate hydrolase family protein [Marinibacterium sp.]